MAIDDIPDPELSSNSLMVLSLIHARCPDLFDMVRGVAVERDSLASRCQGYSDQANAEYQRHEERVANLRATIARIRDDVAERERLLDHYARTLLPVVRSWLQIADLFQMEHLTEGGVKMVASARECLRSLNSRLMALELSKIADE